MRVMQVSPVLIAGRKAIACRFTCMSSGHGGTWLFEKQTSCMLKAVCMRGRKGEISSREIKSNTIKNKKYE